jgi:hypothetical protein
LSINYTIQIIGAFIMITGVYLRGKDYLHGSTIGPILAFIGLVIYLKAVKNK